jgi:hypothetical protein
MNITTRFRGGPELQRQIRAIKQQTENLRPLYKQWGVVVHAWIMENYRRNGGLLSTGRWKRLRPLTLAARRGKETKDTAQILQDTGHLKRQWNYRTIRGGVRIGNPMSIAAYHEKGTDPYVIRPKNRKYLWFGVKPAQRRRGQKLGGYLQTVTDSVKSWGGKGPPGIFAKKVNHPGLPARRQLPNEAEITPRLIAAGDAFLKRVIK